MKTNQLTQGKLKRVMYVENKDGDIEGVSARIGWVTFSKTGISVKYRGKTLRRSKGRPVNGNFFDVDTNETYWVSGIKRNGSNQHPCERISVQVDGDAREEYQRIKSGDSV